MFKLNNEPPKGFCWSYEIKWEAVGLKYCGAGEFAGGTEQICAYKPMTKRWFTKRKEAEKEAKSFEEFRMWIGYVRPVTVKKLVPIEILDRGLKEG